MTKKQQEEVKNITQQIIDKGGFLLGITEKDCQLDNFSEEFPMIVAVVFHMKNSYVVPERYMKKGKGYNPDSILDVDFRDGRHYNVDDEWITIYRESTYSLEKESGLVISLNKMYVDIEMLEKEGRFVRAKGMQVFQRNHFEKFEYSEITAEESMRRRHAK